MPQNGTITISDDDLQQSADPAQIGQSFEQAGQSGPGILSKAFSWLNRPTVSPDASLNFLTSGQQGKGTGDTVSALEQRSVAPPSKTGQFRSANIPGFGQIDLDKFIAGLRASEGRTLSGFSTPASIGTVGLASIAKLPGAIGKVARSLLTAQGIGYGAEGAGQVAEGLEKGATTPEGAEKILSGSSQVLGAAPSVAEAGRIARGGLAKVAPGLFSKGEASFVSALEPGKKSVTALRRAYRGRAVELSQAPIRDLPDLANYAEVKRVNAAQELNRRLVQGNAQATRVDAVSAGNEIRGKVTKLLELSSPKEAQAIRNYATRVEQELIRRPIGLGEAEAMVQELNAKSAAFDKLPPEAQRQRLAEGDPILGEKALKESLQSQIEAKFSQYSDLKRQYGDWKEIQNQTQARIDDLERKGTHVGYAQRRALEALLSMGGMFEGARHGGLGVGLLSGLGGYMAGRFAADMILNRLATPERALQRGVRPPIERPIPFGLQTVQPVAAGTRRDDASQ